jgi:ubiquinone/menaquinone biosynthesis C-methylase UbiE/uncharacterized protein YbaR (Trm112 family)
MRSEILNILKCPLCSGKLHLMPFGSTSREVRRGALTCTGAHEHAFEIDDGIIRFQTGFDHEAVKKELEYENSTYKGNERLTDPRLIAQFPDTLAELWPHTCHFGPDFRTLIDHLNLPQGAWVLDVGTGPCWSTRLLAQRGYKAIALDVNDANYYGLRTSDMLFEAHPGVYFERILESMTNLPFRDDSLDAITFNASFHHTPDMERTLKECLRVLKPGGVAAMVNEEFASVRQRVFSRGESTDGGSHHTIHYSEFDNAVKNLGFEVDYFVAEHVARKLDEKLPKVVSKTAVRTLEAFPFLLKQLNSALITMRKPGRIHSELRPTAYTPQAETAVFQTAGSSKAPAVATRP